MTRLHRLLGPSVALLALPPLLLAAPSARADPANGKEYLRKLGEHAQKLLEPHRDTIGAVVRLPPGTPGDAFGLKPYAPGFSRLRGTATELLAFGDAHPELPFEVAPPLHLLLNRVGLWTHAAAERAAGGGQGEGTYIGIADTGIDFSLADFLDKDVSPEDHAKILRVAWMLDLSLAPAGLHGDLEKKYGGAVFSGEDLYNLIGNGEASSGEYTDFIGHGTHVASIAAGNGGAEGKYVGIAPKADLVIAHIVHGTSDDLASDDVLTGVQFCFDMADRDKKPIAVNLSIGTDFGPHDGSVAWEEALAAFVGPDHPGRALAVAAGNSGDIASSAVHATVYVPPGETRRIPITTSYSATDGQVQVWVTMRGDANLAVGLDAPSGTWVAPVPENATGGASTVDAPGPDGGSGYQASVTNGASVADSGIPANSHSAIVVWDGSWPAGTYWITLQGHGVADLYVEGAGDAVDTSGLGVGFTNPVREGTINIPATNAGLLAVGCTVNRPSWTSIDDGPVSVSVSPLDPRGGYVVDGGTYSLPVTGDVCWFSSAGPTVTGVPKPEISAPGGIVIGAMSGAAIPTATGSVSIFQNPSCPALVDGGVPDYKCMEVDPTHAIAAGTSMSAPQAAGLAALLFQRDPTLTQDKIVALLQAGAHEFRTGTPRFEDQGGPGELDVQGSLDALERWQDPKLALPSKARSWVTLSADELTADGSTPLTVIVELRTEDGSHRADFFAASRLAPVVQVDGLTLSHLPPLQRRAPGLWTFTITPPPGLGGHILTVGATFDGDPIVAAKSVPIATDTFSENYPAQANGSCSVGGPGPTRSSPVVSVVLALGLWVATRRRRRGHSGASDARASVQPCGSQTRSSGSNG